MLKGKWAIFVLAFICALASAAPASAEWVEDGLPAYPSGQNEMYPVSVEDGEGGVIIAWEDYRSGGGNVDIYAQRIDSYGHILWSTSGVAICTASSNQDRPKITADGAGGAVVVWHDQRGTGADLFAQRVNADGTVLWTTDGVAIYDSFNYPDNYDITHDGTGGAIIAWDDPRTAVYKIYAQRISASGDTLWNGSGEPVCSSTASQYYPAIASDGNHGAFIVWNDGRNTVDWDIYLQRIRADGSLPWSSGVPISSYTGDQMYARIIESDRNSVIMAWEDNRGTDPDVYVMKFDSSGTYHWGNFPVCSATGQQTNIQLASDGDGGAIVVWEDWRTTYGDIYAQRVNAGSVKWATDGVGVCDAAGNQMFPLITDDGLGGAVIAWNDSREDPYSDIFTQKIGHDGNAVWADDGIPLCSVYGSQQTVFGLTYDGLGGAIGVWSDGRDVTDWDVYAQRVEMNGYWGYPAPAVTAVEDVPYDQGGRVTVTWNASRLDAFPNQVVTHYSVWRKLLGGALSAVLSAASEEDLQPLEESILSGARASNGAESSAGAERALIAEKLGREIKISGTLYRIYELGGIAYGWECLSEMNSLYQSEYTYTAATLYDSTSADGAAHEFMVAAHTGDSFIYWVSEPDSGYSVDNLAPCAVSSVAGEQKHLPEGLEITWAPNSEADLAGYRVYRGASEGFTPGPGNMLSSSCDTLYFDGEWRYDSDYYYKITAVDIHGNESPVSLLGPSEITGEETPDVPAAYYLAQNHPNPFNPLTTIKFGLKERGHVSLRIYDAAGRLVKVLADREFAAGNHEEPWDGRDSGGRQVSSGVYFYSIKSGAFKQTRKMVLMR